MISHSFQLEFDNNSSQPTNFVLICDIKKLNNYEFAFTILILYFPFLMLKYYVPNIVTNGFLAWPWFKLNY